MDRMAAALALVIALLLPAAASAGPAECARTARQIAHFETMVEKAEAGGKADWAESTQAHIDKIRASAVARCPELAHDAKAQAKAQYEAMMALMKIGAKAARMYFTGGAF